MGNPHSKVLSKGYVTGDFVLTEDNPILSREKVTGITNASSSVALDLAPGYPMNGSTPVVQGQESTVTGLLLNRVYIPPTPNNSASATVLKRGPAAISLEALPLVDTAGAAFNMTTLGTAIAALGIIVRHLPDQTTETTTQTT